MAKNTPNPIETPTDIPSWMDWGNLREKTGEIIGRLTALERQFMELRVEIIEIRKGQDRLLYAILGLTLGVVANLAYFIFTQPG